MVEGHHGYGYGVVNARNELAVGLAAAPGLPAVEWRVRLLQTIHRNVAAIDVDADGR